jgi:deoxyribose-phosphate aldolase
MRNSSVQVLRNPGIGFDQSWIDLAPQSASFDLDRETPAISAQEAGVIASLLDLTSLNSDDTAESIRALFADAVQPLPGSKVQVAGVCVYPAFLNLDGTGLRNHGVRLVTVAGGFPHALSPREARVAEIRICARLADEVDFPIPRYLALAERWEELYFDISELVVAAAGSPVKVILATGELPNQQSMYRAATVAMMAGAAFVKTSTGKERINARLDAGSILCRAIKDYAKRTEFQVGLKPAGGIRTPDEALRWVHLVRGRLGEEWVTPELFRIGASSLLEHLRYVVGD